MDPDNLLQKSVFVFLNPVKAERLALADIPFTQTPSVDPLCGYCRILPVLFLSRLFTHAFTFQPKRTQPWECHRE